MNYTSVEQSKKLIELGLSSKSADNVIISIGDREGVKTITMPKETFNILRTPFTDIRNTTPCWSITALLKLIPNGVLAHMDEDGETYWYCNTINYGEDFYDYDGHYTESPIDAIMEVIVWLIENNHANNLCFNN